MIQNFECHYIFGANNSVYAEYWKQNRIGAIKRMGRFMTWGYFSVLFTWGSQSRKVGHLYTHETTWVLIL